MPATHPLDKLSDYQLASFDQDYWTEPRWQRARACIDRDFPDGRFSFIDVGGGNGSFADRVLAAYPDSTGGVLDTSELLLSKNSSLARKRLIRADALDIGRYGPVDIVFCNSLLHHLVSTHSYRQSRANVVGFLMQAAASLSERGRLSIWEIDYNGIIDNLPGRAIFALTSSRTIAGLTRRLGANTAGVGVCFLSHREWVNTIRRAGLALVDYWSDTEDMPMSLEKRAFFLIRRVAGGYYWVGRERPAGA